MKLSDFLKKYEGLDPNTEVDSTGRVLSNYEIAYNLGFNAKSKKDNPYDKSLLEWNRFNEGFDDRKVSEETYFE